MKTIPSTLSFLLLCFLLIACDPKSKSEDSSTSNPSINPSSPQTISVGISIQLPQTFSKFQNRPSDKMTDLSSSSDKMANLSSSSDKITDLPSDIVRIVVDVTGDYSGILEPTELTKSGETWSGTLDNLPVGISLTFTAHAYSNTTIEIFIGTTNQTLTGNSDEISIALGPISAPTITFPRILGVQVPAEVETTQTGIVNVVVSGNSGETLSYSFLPQSGGGSFSPASGNITLSGTTGTISTTYTGPNSIGKYKHSVEVKNSQNNVVGDQFVTNVVQQLTTSGVTIAFNPVITGFKAIKSDNNILWTATVIDDDPQSTLRYQWEFDGGLQFSDETTNPATLLNYVTVATGNIKLTVTDNNGTGGSSSVTFAIPQFSGFKPVANAGNEQYSQTGTPVILDGSLSSDADGDPLTYQWVLESVPVSSDATLDNPILINPSFTPDVSGNYLAKLIVNDGYSNSEESSILVRVNQAPNYISGVISTDTTWDVASGPVIVTGNTLVENGTTLTIEPGVLVKFETDTILQIEGQLIARGTENNRIRFTSNQSNPGSGDWSKISFSGNSVDASFDGEGNYVSGSILQYCEVSYAGSGAVRLNSSDPWVDHCLIEKNSGNGIEVYAAMNPTISNNQIQYNQGSGIHINGNTEKISITKNKISNNTGSGIYASRSRIHYGTGYYIEGNEIKSNSYGVYFYKNVAAIIINNLIKENSNAGIYCDDSSAARGPVNLSKNVLFNNQLGIDLNISSYYSREFTVTENVIINNSGQGLIAALPDNRGELTIRHNHIHLNSGNGMEISGEDNSSVHNNSITGNSGIGLYSNNSSLIEHNLLRNNITELSVGNALAKLNNNNITPSSSNLALSYTGPNGTTLDAENNWWGTTDEITIQQQIHDWAEDGNLGLTDSSPYLTTPDLSAPLAPPTGFSLSVANTDSLALQWTTNQESDLAGYKIYWDASTDGYQYSGVIDVGNVTSYSLTGLNPGTAYFVGVTAYDSTYQDASDDLSTLVNENQTQGRESWFSSLSTSTAQ